MVRTTPEGKLKDKVDKLLREYPIVWSFMPVQMGRGKTGLDYHCIIRAGSLCIAFFVETKAPGEWLSTRQELLIGQLNAFNAKVFIVENDVDLARLKQWLDHMQRLNTIPIPKNGVS